MHTVGILQGMVKRTACLTLANEEKEKKRMADNKKNVIPLVLAVVLALAAVFAVNRLIAQKTPMAGEEMVEVVVVSRSLSPGEVINISSLRKKVIPRTAAPSKAVFWNQRSVILNQKVLTAVSEGDYLVLDNIGVSKGLSDMVGDGEWGIPVSLNGGAITSRLRPGDEIAIIATFKVKPREAEKHEVESKADKRSQTVTTVLMPRVKILALDGNQQQGGDQFVLALSPAEAQIIVSAQANGIELSPALRRPYDNANLDRKEAKMVKTEVFEKMIQGIEMVEVPIGPK